MREQSRIKADTVAEECTCSVCHERGCPIPAPAPEPSAPPAGVPVCSPGCGKVFGKDVQYCREACCDAGRPLNPPPSDPVTVATGGPGSAHPAPFAHDCGIVSDDEIPTAEEGAETCKRLGIDVPAWAADVRARVAAVAGVGVPVVKTTTATCPAVADDGTRCERLANHNDYWHQAGEYGWHSYSDTARSVPPGPVPLEARPSETLTDLLRWQPTAAEVQAAQLPAAPASEPAVRPLSEALRAAAEDLKRLLQYRDADGRLHSPAHGVLGAWKNLVRRFEEVAALEAERDALSDSLADERLTSARARTEVEQLRGKLADAEKEAREWQEAAVGNEQTADERVLAAGDQATARVRSMREAAVDKVRRYLLDLGYPGLADSVDIVIRALPLDTGTATDTAGEAKCVFASVLGLEKCKTCNPSIDAAEQPQADAIKAPVADERERCLAWYRLGGPRAEEGIRSGAVAPGAVGK